jgi:Tol biopolymer transport system component
MALTAGTRLGPYELLAPIGAGGMGQVWSARDSRLDRTVAIKFSNEQFTERFEREARSIAALNHPHVCTLFDVGPDYLVMELVEGPTLAERIAEGPMSLDEVLPIARQIAEALEAAHERGIVHRDLKPANVKLTAEGNVKVLDFGLAKALEPEAAAASSPASSPTLTLSATRAGMILGTAGYMSPEQARGKIADRRADIWSFGVVLYEMLCGKPLYSGELASDLLAAVILKDPDWAPLPASTPPRIRELLERCLRKDPKMRLRDIGDARIAIEEYLAKPDQPMAAAPPVAPAARPRVWPLWIAAALGIACLSLAAMHFTEKTLDPALVRFKLLAPENASFGNGMAISPDGRRIVFLHSADATGRLWLQPLDSLAPQPLSGTDGASAPFWSPDSKFIGFFQQGKLRKVEAAGGPPQTLCDVTNTAIGGSWNQDGVIVFGTNASGLFRVPQAGGAASPLTELNPARAESFHGRPWFLPDGKHYFFYANSRSEQSAIFIGSLDSKERKPVVAARQGGQYAPPAPGAKVGHLLFLREGTLMAQPLDPRTLDAVGDAFPIAEQVGYNITLPYFTVSPNGILVHRGGGDAGTQRLTWFDRDGKSLGTVGPSGVYSDPAISPDGKRVAISKQEEGGGQLRDLWLIDMERGVPTRFTFDRANTMYPVWSPDGSQVAYVSAREAGTMGVYRKNAGGAAADELMLKTGPTKRTYDWSSDGRYLLFSVIDPKSKADLWLLSNPAGPVADLKPRPLLASEFSETQGQFCPNGSGPPQWFAYTSDESGKEEIYVQPFSENGAASSGKFQISSSGGVQPRWRRDGKELYYLGLDSKLMAVEIKTSPRFEHGAPRPLFQTRVLLPAPVLRNAYHYAVSADGKRFLVDDRQQETAAAPMTVVLNWNAGLRQK